MHDLTRLRQTIHSPGAIDSTLSPWLGVYTGEKNGSLRLRAVVSLLGLKPYEAPYAPEAHVHDLANAYEMSGGYQILGADEPIAFPLSISREELCLVGAASDEVERKRIASEFLRYLDDKNIRLSCYTIVDENNRVVGDRIIAPDEATAIEQIARARAPLAKSTVFGTEIEKLRVSNSFVVTPEGLASVAINADGLRKHIHRIEVASNIEERIPMKDL